MIYQDKDWVAVHLVYMISYWSHLLRLGGCFFFNIHVQSVREHQENILMQDYSAFKEQIKAEQDYIWTSAELRAALYDADIIYFSSTFSSVFS